MRTILFIIQKEFIQVFRNRMMMPIIFVVPIVQLLVLVHAATFEMKSIKMAVIDFDMSTSSRELVSKFRGSPFYVFAYSGFSYKEAENEMKKGKADVIMTIPRGFEKQLVRENKSKVQLVINAINGTSAGLINAYSFSIILDFNRQIILELLNPAAIQNAGNIDITTNYWYNPKLNYKTYMVPGILVLLVTIISFLLSGMNVVREKEIGTIEQLNVTPIRKLQFIAGKLIPFWIIAMFELAFGLLVGKLLFNIPIVGSLGLIFLSAGIYLMVILGFGLLISTGTNTQQQSMLVSFFFMVIFILMSGLFTSIESMPHWAQMLDRLNPIAYFIKIMRMIMLKGSGWEEIKILVYSLLIYAVLSISLAVWRYRKVS
ncbi:MAG: ABC transporter permease [Bacteroidota bacterium]